MAWIKLDDQIPRHPKILKAGPAAAWLWVCGISHCQNHLTDGFIDVGVLPFLGIPAALVKPLVDKLVAAGLWERAENGYQVHDYLRHNASKATILERREEVSDTRSKAGRTGGLRSAANRRTEANVKQTSEAVATSNQANAEQTGEANIESVLKPSPLLSSPLHSSPLLSEVRTSAADVISSNERVRPPATAAERFRPEEWKFAKELRAKHFGCQHDPKCATVDDCLIALMRDVRRRHAAVGT